MLIPKCGELSWLVLRTYFNLSLCLAQVIGVVIMSFGENGRVAGWHGVHAYVSNKL